MKDRKIVNLMDESQIAGYIVVAANGNMLDRGFGTLSGRLFKSEHAAGVLQRQLDKADPDYDYVVLPVQRDFWDA
jgi:hypothetical protein